MDTESFFMEDMNYKYNIIICFHCGKQKAYNT